MKILHICTYDVGGAGKACVRLHQGLMEQGLDSKLLLLHQSNKTLKKSYHYIPHKNFEKLKSKLKKTLKEFHLHIWKDKYDKRKFLQNRPKGFEQFSFPDTPFDITQHPLYLKADIINLHWTAEFLDYVSFFKNNSKKIVWTLHDMNPFTGGCHYAGDCSGFEKNCFKCPQLSNTIDDNYSNKILQTKIKAIEREENLTIVPTSNWLLNQSKKSVVFNKFSHVQIPYGLNHNIFKPTDKKYSRELLGLPLDKKIILFVSASLDNKRKGFEYLLKATEQLNEQEDVALCAVGNTIANELNKKNLFYLGNITDERLMSAVYSAADVFIIPSLEDNFPNTVLESLMCGTPVIGFPIGGIIDMVEDGKNGYLCENVSSDALTITIRKYLNKPDLFKSDEIRKEALKKYDLPVQAEAYIALYKELMNQ